YRGHVPTTRYLYGDTFGNATVKYFQNFRCAVMESSKSPYSSGGQFPTIYSHNPCLVTACRSRSRDRALHTPYWARNNVDFSRQEELKLFDKERRCALCGVEGHLFKGCKWRNIQMAREYDQGTLRVDGEEEEASEEEEARLEVGVAPVNEGAQEVEL
ncbi:C070A protein, partial [Atractosteus spatula]|nr:C070A protein [Atractosteus spatula]